MYMFYFIWRTRERTRVRRLPSLPSTIATFASARDKSDIDVHLPPQRFPQHRLVLGFLFLLFRLGVCCYLTGLFLQFIAGFLEVNENVCYRATEFLTLSEAPVLQFLFQRVHKPPPIVSETTFTILISRAPSAPIFSSGTSVAGTST
jgi:hypothetical protein